MTTTPPDPGSAPVPATWRRGLDLPVLLVGLVGGLTALWVLVSLGILLGYLEWSSGQYVLALVLMVVLTMLATPRGVPGRLWLAVIPAVQWCTMTPVAMAFFVSWPLAAVLVVVSGAVVAVAGWRFLVAQGHPNREAMRYAATVVLACQLLVCVFGPALLTILIVALSAEGLWPVVVAGALLAPLAPVVWLRSLGRSVVAPVLPARETPRAPIVWRVVVPGAVVIALLAVWAFWPVFAGERVDDSPPPVVAPVPGSVGEADESEVPQGADEPVDTAVVPFAALSPDETRALIRLEASGPTPADACDPAALEATLAFNDAAMGHRYATITLRNTSAEPCTLHGYPGLGARGAWGHRFTPQIEQTGMTEDFQYTPTGQSPDAVTLAPGVSALVPVEWTGALGGAESEPLGDLVLQTAPGAVPVRVADPAGDGSDIGQFTTLRVGPFQPAP